MTRSRWSAASAALLAVVAALSGCAPTAVSLPDGVSVSVFQTRFDYALHQVQVRVSNDSAASITIVSATLESTRFVSPVSWTRPQSVPAGSARDLPLALPAAQCDAVPVDTVTLSFELDDGAQGQATLTPSDPAGRLDAITEEDCLAAAVSAVALVTASAPPIWSAGAQAPAGLTLTVAPTGEDGTVSIAAVHSTVLFSLVDDSGQLSANQDLDLTIDENSAAAEIRLLLAPTRCDAHALADDKRGTFFALDVRTDDRSGVLTVAASDAVRAGLYEFYADYCDLR